MSEKTNEQRANREELTAQEAQEAPKEQPGCIEVETPAPDAEPDAEALAESAGKISERLNLKFNAVQSEALKKAIRPIGQMQAKALQNSFSTLQTGVLNHSIRAMEHLQKQMQGNIVEALKGTSDALNALAASMQERLQGNVATAMQDAVKGMTAFLNSDKYSIFKANMAAIASLIEQHRAELEALAGLPEGAGDLLPFLSVELEELEEAQRPAELDGCTLIDILEQGLDEDGNPIDGPFREILERARQRMADFEAAEETIEAAEQAAEELPRIIANPTDLLTYPLDKPNSYIWNLLAEADPDGQLTLEIDTTGGANKKKGKEAIIVYGINFDELDGVRFSKQLTPFDKRVYIAAAALLNAGNSVMTATQIHRMMGNKGQPKAGQVEKINESLDKMRAATVFIDNTRELKVNKGYPKFVYDGALIEFRRISAYINNTRTDSAIRLLAEPPLITFARERKQITSVPRLLLESPVSKTDANLMIDDYLIDRISHMRNSKKVSRRILFAKIFERCKIRTIKQKQRAPQKIRRYLDYYQRCSFIKGYTEDKDGITIQL